MVEVSVPASNKNEYDPEVISRLLRSGVPADQDDAVNATARSGDAGLKRLCLWILRFNLQRLRNAANIIFSEFTAADRTLIHSELGSPSSRIRELAVYILGERGDERDIEVLVKTLIDYKVGVRENSRASIGKIIKRVVQRLRASNPDIASDHARKLINPFITSIQKSGGKIRESFVSFLFEFREFCDPHLWELYHESPDSIRGIINDNLRMTSKPEIIQMILEGIISEDEEIHGVCSNILKQVREDGILRIQLDILNRMPLLERDQILWKLLQLGVVDRYARLIQKLDSSRYIQVLEMMELLGRAKHHRELLVKGFFEQERMVQLRIIKLLASINDEDSSVQLLSLLSTTDENLMEEIIIALGQIGDAAALKPLIPYLNHLNMNVRREGLKAVIAIGRKKFFSEFNEIDETTKSGLAQLLRKVDPVIIEDLITDLNSLETEGRTQAVQMLAYLGTDEKGEALLWDLLRDSNDMVRATVIKTVAAISDPEKVIEVLIKALNDDDDRVRANAIEALVDIRGEQASSLVLPFTRDRNNRVRSNAIRALWLLGNHGVIDALRDSLIKGDAKMRASAAWVLGEIREARHRELLVDLLNDHETNVRKNVIKALQKIPGIDHINILSERPLDPDPEVRGLIQAILSPSGTMVKTVKVSAEDKKQGGV